MVTTGTVAKKDLSKEDINLIVDLFESIQPRQIYAAGDLSDPHGTHRTCLKVILRLHSPKRVRLCLVPGPEKLMNCNYGSLTAGSEH